MRKTIICGNEIKETFEKDQAFDLDLSLGSGEFGLTFDQISKHLMFLGSPGTGKTNAINILIDELLMKKSAQDSLFIFDTKGDFYREFGHRPCKKLVISNEYPKSACWNIFGEIMDFDQDRVYYDKKNEIYAREIAKMLFADKESDHQPFFHNAASDITSKVILYFLRQAKNMGDTSMLNNYFLANFLKIASKEDLLRILASKENPDFKGAIEYINSADGQSQGVLSFIKEMAADLLVGVFGGYEKCQDWENQFSIRNLVKNQAYDVVFIDYDISASKAQSPIYKVIVDLILKFSMSGREDYRNRIYLILDEISLLPKLNYLSDGLTFGRSRGLRLIAGIQSVDLIYDTYGTHLGNVIISNFMNIVAFYLSDAISRDFVSKYFGLAYLDYSFSSGSRHFNTQREGHVVEDWEQMNLEMGQAFVKIAGLDPIKYKFRLYKED